jgi:molecular chaperone GrpE
MGKSEAQTKDNTTEKSQKITGEKLEELLTRIDELERETHEKNKEIEDDLSILQRLQAEFENYKKRAERERVNYTEKANADLVMRLLPVLDNFERALSSNHTGDSFKKGMEMIFSQLITVLEKEGLSLIEAAGEPFDPYYHEAVLAVEGDYDEDTVTEELEKGYLFKNKVLRPTKVKVGKRGD